MNDLKVELKVCEGCGALWLRAVVKGGIYCRRCARVLAEFPHPRRRGTTKPSVVCRAGLTKTQQVKLSGGAR